MEHPAEEPLADLGFKQVLPAPVLRSYIRSYWYFRLDAPLPAFREEFMHPRGGFGIGFNFGDALQLDAQPLTAPLFLDGANTQSRKMGFHGRIDLIGVRFYEGGAYPFFGIPLSELLDEVMLLDVLKPSMLLSLHARLYDASSSLARIQLLEQWLLFRLAQGKARDAIIPASLARLRNENLSIPALADEFAISQRQLERLFRIQVGLSPKHYTRLLRVESARTALKQLDQESTTDLAMRLGFYDQSHFIREFQEVVGMTPYRYMKRKRE